MNEAARGLRLVLAGFALALAIPASSSPLAGGRDVLDPDGNVIRTAPPAGRVEVPPRAATPALRVVRGDGPSGEAAACASVAMPFQELRSRTGDGFAVDPCGRVHLEDGSTTVGLPAAPTAPALPLTIDRMTTSIGSSSYSPGGTFRLLGPATTYYLNDGSQWASGAGSAYTHWSQFVSVEVTGTTIRYTLSPPEVGAVYEQTDYDSGNHSSQGKLTAASPLVIEAQVGSTTAVLHGSARVASNDPTYYGEPRFNYFSAVVGSVVPFDITYNIQGTTWQADTFTRSFSYSGGGAVDFAHPVSIPRALEISILGMPRIHGDFVTSYRANVVFDSGVTRNMATLSDWTVDHPELASISQGVLTVGSLTTPRETLNLGATLVWGADTLVAQKPVLCLAADPAERPGSWPMFQANAKHTGYIPFAARPEEFRLRWRSSPAGARALNPAAAGEGKVFVTASVYFNDIQQLFALRTSDGAPLWSKGFGSVNSVNPPSYAYGNVYVQTGNHSTDTWLRAFDGETGAELLKVPHEAQWERYFAPTMFDGKAYVDGGYYGGMYAFDAYSGAQLWYTTLPQYDQWTPAVEETRVFAYLGEYYPGLYVKDRVLGVPGEFFVADPNFDWNGWSMNLAPVIGAHGDVLAIHNSRLISFDPDHGVIAWELPGAFTGQPSVAKDRVYATRSGQLVVLDETTHAELWSWQPPSGSITGPVVVTDTHVFASTSSTVHAIDLATHQSAWSYAAAGQLAIADDTLFIAGSDGWLTAIALAVPPTATVTGDGVICEGQPASVPIQAVLTGTPPWSVTWSDGFVQGNVLSSPATRSVSPSSSTTYTVTSVNDAVASGTPSGQAAVAVNPVPATPAPTNDGPVCEGAPLHLSTASVAGATYSWTGPNGFTSASQSPEIAAATSAMAGDFEVRLTVDGCTSAAGSTHVTVQPDSASPVVAPPASITVDQALCCGNTGGATGASSEVLAAFLSGGTATDDCDANPTRLAPQVGAADATSSTCFEVGGTSVAFRFRDSSGKTGSAAANVTVRMFADLNQDDVVDPSDMVVLRAYFNFAIVPGTAPFTAPLGMADLNHDAAVDPTDLVVLRGYFNFAVACLAP